MKNMPILVRRFPGLQDYQPTWRAMQEFTRHRDNNTDDEIWLLQHHPVFTVGQAGKPEHLLSATTLNGETIPLVKSDRGGQITYHGPGQIVAYLLLDLKRRQLGVRDLVTLMEQSVIEMLHACGLHAYAKKSAPGVYVTCGAHTNSAPQDTEHKIAALGLRVKQGCSYHGLALNVDMDLSPFAHINPCGYAGLSVTQLANLLPTKPRLHDMEDRLLAQLAQKLDAELIETAPKP